MIAPYLIYIVGCAVLNEKVSPIPNLFVGKSPTNIYFYKTDCLRRWSAELKVISIKNEQRSDSTKNSPSLFVK